MGPTLNKSHGLLHYLAYVLLCFIWGSTWLFIKVGYGNLGPFNSAAVRFVIAGGILVVLVPVLRAPWPRGRREWLLVLWVGILIFAVDYAAVYWAETRLDSGLTAIIFAVLPVLTTVAAHFYLETERLTPRKLAGTIIAFAGVATLLADRFSIDASQILAMLAVLAGVCGAVGGTLVMKRYGSSLHPAALNAPAMLIGAVLLFLAAVVSGEKIQLPSDPATWGAVFYLAVVGSVVAFLSYFWLLKTWTATSLGFINVFTPVVAVVLGFIFRGERLTPWTGAGGALILGGVVLAMWKRD